MSRTTPTVLPEREYHRVLVGEKRRIARGVLAILLVMGGLTFFTIVFAAAATAVDAAVGRDAGSAYSPLVHAAGIGAVALLIPWSMFIQRWLYGVKGASLHSVISRFRFDRFGRAILFSSPVFLGVVVLQYLDPLPQTTWTYSDVLWMLAGTLLLVPLQAAGEEYGFRGLVFRVGGSWARGARAGLVVGIVVSSVAFMIVHLQADLVLNLWYLVFAVSTALITWRTGGIEVAVVLHALFNVLTFTFDTALRIDFGAVLADPSASMKAMLPVMLVMVGAALVVWVRTRRTGPIRTPRLETAA